MFFLCRNFASGLRTLKH